MTVTLFVGDRNYSSWSLRPWLVLMWSGLTFETQDVSLDQEGYGRGLVASVLDVSPSGRVPALHAGDLKLWDSLAISEWVAETAPAARLWPEGGAMRALARAATAEMHAGFVALRRDLPMNIRRRCPAQDWPQDTRDDLGRLNQLWTGMRRKYGSTGSFLFGARSIADAFFTPVATRLRTYSVELSPDANAYRDTLLSEPAFQMWEASALAGWKKPFSRAPFDALYT